MTTLDDLQTAKQLARQLVESRLAACVHLVERIHSTYRWQGAIETAEEILLIVKTVSDLVPALKEKILELHPYQLPELVVLPVADISDAYLTWLIASTRAD